MQPKLSDHNFSLEKNQIQLKTCGTLLKDIYMIKEKKIQSSLGINKTAPKIFNSKQYQCSQKTWNYNWRIINNAKVYYSNNFKYEALCDKFSLSGEKD